MSANESFRTKSIIVRKERPNDIKVVRTVNEKAFGQPVEANLIDKLRTSYSDTLPHFPLKQLPCKSMVTTVQSSQMKGKTMKSFHYFSMILIISIMALLTSYGAEEWIHDRSGMPCCPT
ncbi:MAG: hypothetical protein PHR77_22170, partial [Kiritimatiellae bacterium]|nr:hypothetical protein [Kiritimatiellia bacterium]